MNSFPFTNLSLVIGGLIVLPYFKHKKSPLVLELSADPNYFDLSPS